LPIIATSVLPSPDASGAPLEGPKISGPDSGDVKTELSDRAPAPLSQSRSRDSRSLWQVACRFRRRPCWPM